MSDAVLRRDDIDAVTICTPERPARRPRGRRAGRRQARRRREADRRRAGRGRPDHRRGEALREDRRRHLPAPLRQVHREGPRTPCATGTWARSPRRSPRTPGGGGSPTTTPATGAAPGRWTAAAPSMNQTVHTINLMVTILGIPVEVFAYTGLPRPRAHRGRGHRRRGGEVRLRRARRHPRHDRRLPRPGRQPARSSAPRAPPSSPTTSWSTSTRTPATPRRSACRDMTGANQVTDEDRLHPEDPAGHRAPPPAGRLRRRHRDRPSPAGSAPPRPAPRCR